MQYENAVTVAVGLVFPSPEEVLVVRRGIPPFVGELALPGGYVEIEDWREALKREIEEETGITVSTDPKHMQTYEAESTPDKKKILLFAVVRPSGILQISDFVPNAEVSERLFVPCNRLEIPQLCFPLHTKTLERYRREQFGE